jgi:stage II sporulation protein D
MGRALAAACLSIWCARPAFAEEEVRISIGSGTKPVVVSGDRLAIFDGDTGDRLYAWSGGGTAEIRKAKDRLSVRAKDRAIASAPRLLVEAVDSVRVDRGVYFGRIEVSLHDGSISVINRLPLETYLLGIIGSEMNPGWPIEALKAQAVAARTYAMQKRMAMRAAKKPFDLGATVLSQVYKGAENIRPAVIEAVKETRGEVLAFDHDLVQALFHSTCGGRTVSAKSAFGSEVPYLKPQTCRWCRDSTRHRWEITMSLDEMTKRLKRARLTKSNVTAFSRMEETSPVRLESGKQRQQLSPKRIREAVGFSELYSSRFTAETAGKTIHIHGRGFGHGVGMCQWGAKGMAEAGKDHYQILEHYYRGVRVKRIY